MGFWARLFGLEKREMETPQETTLTLSDFLNLIGTEKMSAEKAMEIPAFSASVDFIAQTVAELPIELYKEIPGERKAKQITDDPRLFALNDESEYLMTALEAKKALITDMLLYGAGYMYIGEGARTLHYVDCRSVSVQKNTDPIFKDADIRVNERKFYPWQFVIVTRRSKDGVTGVGAVAEHETVLSAAYNIMKYENTVSRTGGSKKGFLQSEKALTSDAITALKQAWAEFYANNDNQMMVLNNGIKYTPSASTAMEMQLSQNKAANAAQIAQIFGLSPEAVSGRVDNNGFISSMKNAVLPVVAAFKQALNRSLLTESEKRGDSPLYFELDTSALLRADTLSRYQAYAVALQNSFLQIDEVRYMEDKEPLGFDYMKLGLDSVLLDPKTGMLYTPNTNQFTKMGENLLINTAEGDIIEERYSPDQDRDELGRFASGSGGGSAQKNVDKSAESGIIKADIYIGKSLSASAKNYPVRLPDSKQRVKLAEGQTIRGKVFAGYGTSHEIRDRYIVASHYNIPFEEAYKLQKASGNGYVLVDGGKRKAELHWYQMAGDKFAEKYDMKVKRFIDEDKV